MKKIIGALLIASPFIVMATRWIWTDGWLDTLKVFGLGALIVVVITAGVCLLVDDWAEGEQ